MTSSPVDTLLPPGIPVQPSLESDDAPALPPVAVCDVVLFGGTGDLAMRKLLPALYRRDRDGQLTDGSRIVSVSRSALSAQEYVARVRAAVRPGPAEDDAWDRFAARLTHVALDIDGADGWPDLTTLLQAVEPRVRVFYLAVAPRLFGPLSARLADAGLVDERSRVVLEKPIGWDVASARAISDAVGAVFPEAQTFRIDHYLGKETVQNLLALRFANVLLEPLWNSHYVDSVQITVAETVGTGARTDYYDGSGALRDMVQNHLMQLLCLVAMEQPNDLRPDSVRDEKRRVLRSLRPWTPEDVARDAVRGQYTAGTVDGGQVPGYADELGAESSTETFVALKVHVDNRRWSGVPFYLRTGKRLHERRSQVVVQFRPLAHSVFPATAGGLEPNRLVVQLQPDEGVRLQLMVKEPGPGGLRLRPVSLDLSFAEAFTTPAPEAYERLLLDVVRGNPTLFMRRDEVEAAWAWTEPLLQAWADADSGSPASAAPHPYPAGTCGPAAAHALLARDGRTWHEETP